MTLNFWNYISSIGVRSDYDENLVKRIALTNQFCFIALVIFLLSGLNNLSLGDVKSFIIIEGFVLICFIGWYFNRIHLHTTAAVFLFTFISIAIFYFDSYSGFLSGTYLYHFPLILSISFLFDYKSEKKIMFFQFGLVLIFLSINVFTRYTLFKSNFIDDEKRYQMFAFNLIFSVLAVGFFIYLNIKSHYTVNQIILERLSEQEIAKKTIKQTIAEKDVLLTELHHRVKNNLAVIAGLFSLKIDSIKSPEAKEVLIESRNRVRSMALIHNRLYKNSNFANVDFEQYINELLNEIKLSYPSISQTIAINKHISNITLNVNTAIPCGLILNELLSNCYKHAFVGRDNGAIFISFILNGDTIELTVKDNGIGLPKDFDSKESLGITVIQSLCEQLEGTCEFSEYDGTCFKLSFNKNIRLN